MLKIKKAEFTGCYVDMNSLPPGEAKEVAIVGRSNVGKSSLINRLTNRRNLAKSSSTPGKTRTINYYYINGSFYLVDLPGFGYARVSKAEQAKWGKMIELYMKERQQLCGVIQLVDIRHPPTRNDMLMRDWLSHLAIPYMVVATKADKLSRGACLKSIVQIRKAFEMKPGEEPIAFSAVSGQGVDEICLALQEIIE
ncbi:MAG TPA: ribosome biogenesis GTP-binding protein YihA/YsxC [Syntrophomonadaceae bacterium]|nr:ribosome biogenesis GTP-binding protein YihA/YsxC [Syntrophomonadaceae bacterium]